MPLGHRHLGQLDAPELELQVAALGDGHGVLQRLWVVAKAVPHLPWAFKVELLGVHLHTFGIVDRRAGLDAEQDLLRPGMVAADVVDVVGDDQGQPQTPGQGDDVAVDGLLLRQAVVLQLQVEGAREDVGVPARGLLRGRDVLAQQVPRHLRREAGRQGDQAVAVPGQQVLVDTGLIVEAAQLRLAGEGQ